MTSVKIQSFEDDGATGEVWVRDTSIDDGGSYMTVAGAGSLTEATHEDLDTLVHNIAETSYEEATYDGSGFLTAFTIWQTSAKLKKVRETTITLDGDSLPSVVVTVQYDAAGVAVAAQTITQTITRSSGIFASAAVVQS